MIDKSTPIPLYYQIMEDIKQQINEQKFKNGDKLPTENWMMEHYNVSRVTIRKALSELVAQEQIMSKRGKGNFVVGKKLELPLASMTSLHKMLTAAGINSSSKILSVNHCGLPVEIAEQTGLPEGEAVCVVHRIRLADGEPISDQTTYIREKFCKNLNLDELQQRSLYEMLEEDAHVRIIHSFQIFRTKMPDKIEMENLQLAKRIPLLSIIATVYNDEGDIIEYSINDYVSDRYQYALTLKYNSDS